MSESQHTPGPWLMSKGHVVYLRDMRQQSDGILDTIEIGTDKPNWVAHARTWEDARLIAAAPDLLAELKRADRLILKMATVILEKKCADYIPHGLEGETREYLRSGTPAIAKAEGRA